MVRIQGRGVAGTIAAKENIYLDCARNLRKNVQGECKKASLLVFFAEPQPFLCKKCGNGGNFLIANIGMQVEEAEPFFLKLVDNIGDLVPPVAVFWYR